MEQVFVQLEIECTKCKGTGLLFPLFPDEDGTGIVCDNCNGSGKGTLKYTPFTGLKRIKGVLKVQRPAVSIMRVGKPRPTITYEEFLAGKRPDHQ